MLSLPRDTSISIAAKILPQPKNPPGMLGLEPSSGWAWSSSSQPSQDPSPASPQRRSWAESRDQSQGFVPIQPAGVPGRDAAFPSSIPQVLVSDTGYGIDRGGQISYASLEEIGGEPQQPTCWDSLGFEVSTSTGGPF